MYMHMSIHMYMHMSVHMSIHMSVHMFTHMSIHISIYMSINMPKHIVCLKDSRTSIHVYAGLALFLHMSLVSFPHTGVYKD